MRYTLTIDDDLHAYIKTRAEAAGTTMGRVASDMIREGFRLHDLAAQGSDVRPASKRPSN